MKGCGRSGPNHPKSRCAIGIVMPSAVFSRQVKEKENFMILGEEMMSCCLTKETHQTALRLVLTKSETAGMEAGEQSIPRTATFIA